MATLWPVRTAAAIWILDDIRPLRQIDDALLNRAVHVFESKAATRWQGINTGRKQPYFEFRGANPRRGAAIQFYLRDVPADSVRIEVEDPLTAHRTEWPAPAKRGINRHYWNMSFPELPENCAQKQAFLKNTIDLLTGEVDQPALQDSLSVIKAACSRAEDVRSLNEVRRRLVRNFGGYAAGRPIFGEKLSARPAPQGRYRVRVTSGSQRAEGWIDVRNDPLLHK